MPVSVMKPTLLPPSEVETITSATEFTWIEPEEHQHVDHRGEEFACYSKACAPPSAGGSGGSLPGKGARDFDVSRGSKAKGSSGTRSHKLEDMSAKGEQQALDVLTKIPGMGGLSNVGDAVDEVEARILATVDVALERGYDKVAAQASAKWYDVAHDYANTMAGEFGLNHNETAAAVLAALSPSAAWEGNVRNARELIKMATENKPITDAGIEAAHERSKAKLQSLLVQNKVSADRKAKAQAALDELNDPAVLEGLKKKYVGKNFLDVDDDMQATLLNGHIQGNNMKGITLVPKPDGSYNVQDYKSKTTVQSNAIVKKTLAIVKADIAGKTSEQMQDVISANISQQSKVRAFYKNIADPLDTKQAAVTLDTHAWTGMYTPVNAVTSKPFFQSSTEVGFVKTYPIAREAMERAAPKIAARIGVDSLSPRQVQSVIWEMTRYLTPIKGKGQILSGKEAGEFFTTPEIDAAYARGDHKAALDYIVDAANGPQRP